MAEEDEVVPLADDGAALPFATLTPDRILDAVESVGIVCDGRLSALNSYENRVYQVGVESAAPVVVKFYRPLRWSDAAIAEEHAFVVELAEREIPVVAPLDCGTGSTLHHYQDLRFAIFPRRGGRAPEFGRTDVLEWMGRFVARIHNVGALAPFAARPLLDVASYGRSARDYLIAHDFIPPDLIESWSRVADLAIDAAAQAFDSAGAIGTLRLHGDCHAGNVLWTDDGPHFVDFDDARTGPAVQDLWMLLAGDRVSCESQLVPLLAGYRAFREFDPRELLIVEALRSLRLIHYSAWLAERWHDPAFKMAFPWFGSQRYWQDRILELREQVAAMQEMPLCCP